MDESTLRFFEELGEMFSFFDWDPSVNVFDINDLLAKHLPLLKYYQTYENGWELRIGGRREE